MIRSCRHEFFDSRLRRSLIDQLREKVAGKRFPAGVSSTTRTRAVSFFSSSPLHFSTAPAITPILGGYDESINDEDKERFVLSTISELMGPEFRNYRFTPHSALPVTLEQPIDEQLDPWDDRLDDSPWIPILREDEERGITEVVEADDPWERHNLRQSGDLTPPSIVELIRNFDPQNPPKISDYADRETALEHLEWWLECEAQQEAVHRYQKVLDDARNRRDYGSLGMVQRHIVKWFKLLREAIGERQKQYLSPSETSIPSLKKFGPVICALPADKLAVIAAHTALIAAIGLGDHTIAKNNRSQGGVPFATLALKIGQAVEDEVLIHRLLRKRFLDRQNAKAADPLDEGIANYLKEKADGPDNVDDGTEDANLPKDAIPTETWTYASSHLKTLLQEVSFQQLSPKRQTNLRYAVRKAKAAVENEDEWCEHTKVQLGAALFQLVAETATIEDGGKEEFAFRLEKHWVEKSKIQGYVHLNDRLHSMLVHDKMNSLMPVTTLHKPMIVPPTPWTTCTSKGGYRVLKVEMMRFHGCKTQMEALVGAELTTVVDGLNALGRVRWKINKNVLKIAQECWDENIALGTDIPSRLDLEVPEEPIQPDRFSFEKGSAEHEKGMKEMFKYRERLYKCNRIRQKNLVSKHSISMIRTYNQEHRRTCDRYDVQLS